MFALIQIMHPRSRRPFRIIETYETSDGPRTRVADGHWPTYNEAWEELEKRVKRCAGLVSPQYSSSIQEVLSEGSAMSQEPETPT